MRLLICDKIHPQAVEFLQKKSVPYQYSPEITVPALLNSVHNYDGLLVRGRTKVTSDVIEKGVQLKLIGRVGSGVDNIDMTAARAKNITVINAPDGNIVSVVEHTIGLIISLLRNYQRAFRTMQEGIWEKDALSQTGSELFGKTVGVLGYGHIGKRLVEVLSTFGVNVLIFSKSQKSCTLQQLFSTSDIITLHVVLNEETKGIVSKELIQSMKPTALFLNMARGRLVDESALFEALKNHQIAGAALDVFWEEPLASDSPWRFLPNVLLTPHIGAGTKEAFAKASLTVVADVIRFAKGEKPLNSV